MRTFLALTVMALAAVAGSPVLAQTATPEVATVSTAADLARVEAYLNEVRTLKSDFVQIAHDGSLVKGVFTMKRPGRMRIEYEDPIENFIVADGRFVYLWDAELKQQSNAPIGSTLADFLLRQEIRLSGDVTVTKVEPGAGVLEVTVVQTSDPGLGSLTLVFEDRPFALRKWRVVDAQGLTTEVALLNPQTGVELNDDQFFFRDPTRRQERD